MRRVKIVCYEREEGQTRLQPHNYEGLFHQWGQDSSEDSEGRLATDTVAIVELENGQVKTAYPTNVQFFDKVK